MCRARGLKGLVGFASDKAIASYAPHLVLEPFHMVLDLAFEFPSKTVRGTIKYSIKNNNKAKFVPAASKHLFQTLTLNAMSMDVSSVRAVNQADPLQSVTYEYDGSEIKLLWATPFAADEKREVIVQYSVTKPIAGLYFHVPDATKHPERVMHVVTDHETEKARYWLPCVDYPTVRTSLEFNLTAPASLVSLANGIETGSTLNNDGTKTTSFKLDHLCPSYLLCLAVGEFVEAVDESVNDMPIKYYAPKNYTVDQLKLTFGRTPAMVKWLQKKVGYKFPWPKYYQIISPEVGGGAMENISLVTYNTYFTLDARRALEIGHLTDAVNVHEMAHTYFGDLLVIRHFEHAWLKESWATYTESLWFEDHYPYEEFRLDLISNAASYMDECKEYMRPIVNRTYDSSWDMFDRHTYPGGAWRIHMLRHKLGDEIFWAAVTNYVNRFAGKVVETEDFKRCLEEVSGLNLTLFFDQWIYSAGYPKIKCSFEHHASEELVSVKMEQVHDTPAGSLVAKVFEMDVEVDIIDSEGVLHTGKVSFEAGGPRSITTFVPIGKAKVSVVEIDPRGKVLHALEFEPGETVLEANAKNGKDIGTRIHAFKELIKLGSYTSMKKVRHLLANEPFFGVRALVYRKLAEAKTSPAISILCDSLMTEKQPRALVALTSSCMFRDALIRQNVLTLLGHPSAEQTYVSRAKLYEILGYQRNPDDLTLLLKALDDPEEQGLEGIIRSGVVRALGVHESAGAHAALEARLRSPERDNDKVRTSLLMSLARSADAGAGSVSGEEIKRYISRAKDALVEALRDDRGSVRHAAINALGKLKASEHYSLAKTIVETTFPKIDHPSMLKSAKSLQGGAGGDDAAKLTKTVEELEEKLKKLEKSLEKISAKEELREEAAKAAKEVSDKATSSSVESLPASVAKIDGTAQTSVNTTIASSQT